MYSITCTLSVSLLLILTLIPNSTSAPSYRYNFCSNTTSFDPKSEYQSHLNTVFNSLSANATTPTGFSTAFSNTTNGEVVYGLFLCRGDLDPTSCKDCVTTAASDLQQKYCPNRKVAVIWYDECMVRYSNDSIFAKMEQNPMGLLWNPYNVTGNLTRFTEIVGNLMRNVSSQAMRTGADGKKFGTDMEAYNSLQTVYALGQCTPDLTDPDCSQCLAVAIQQLPVSQGGRVLSPSCNARYESYLFFSSTSPAPPPPPPPQPSPPPSTPVTIAPGRKKHISTKVIIAIVAPVAVVVVTLVGLGACLIRKKVEKYDGVVATETGEDYSAFESLQYDLGTLQSATNNFSDENKLGEGGFGCVYKGTLSNGREIAVKKLSANSSQGVQAFKNEASLVAKFQHRNLVRLLGFCLDGEEKLLIYEYVPNKSLDYFIFDPEKQEQLNWEIRCKIIRGIARGMLYLHQDSQLRIIHRDLKASNVLLDANMNPKISDFGMARIFGVDQTQGKTSRVVGTYGYMSPEYAMHGKFSVKSDVYSFGILILEIVSGKRNSAFRTSDGKDLLSYAWKQWQEGSPLQFVDPSIRDSCSAQEVMRCLRLGLLCVQESADERPTMATILLALDGCSVTLQTPQQPGFILSGGIKSNLAEAGGSDQSSSKSIPWSTNDITVSEIDAR